MKEKLTKRWKREEINRSNKAQSRSNTQRDGELWRAKGRCERVGGQKDGTLSYSPVVKAINSL